MLILTYGLTWDAFMANYKVPPNSMYLIMAVSIVVSLISTWLNKLLIDQDEMKRKQEVITQHNKKKKDLSKMAESDPKKYAKEYKAWKKRDASISKLQQNTSMERLKPTCVTFLPMIIFFYLLRNFYSMNGHPIPVAKPPMNASDVYYIGKAMAASFDSTIRSIPNDEGWINFTGFYFLSSLSFSLFIQKIMGVQPPTQSGGMGSMFDQQTDLPAPKY